MTKETKAAIVGRLMIEFSELQQEVATLTSAFRQTANECEDLYRFLNSADAQQIINLIASIEKHQLKPRAEELLATKKRLEELRRELQGCGVAV